MSNSRVDIVSLKTVTVMCNHVTWDRPDYLQLRRRHLLKSFVSFPEQYTRADNTFIPHCCNTYKLMSKTGTRYT